MLWTLTALSATPAQLAEQIPEATAALERCEAEGCSKAVAARSAWLVALDRYLDGGVADGALSASVRELDPELFSGFPDVLRDAATEPLPWVLGLEEPVVVAHGPPVEVEPAQTLSLKQTRGRLTVAVVDKQGSPVPNAVVRFVDEQENHLVNIESGQWTGSARYLPDGSERGFNRDDRVELEVFAPGYSYERVSYLLRRKRKNLVRIQLTPWMPELAQDAPEIAHEAVATFQRWVEADRARLEDPSKETATRAKKLQRATGEVARSWLDQGGAEPARVLCLMGRNLDYCGD